MGTPVSHHGGKSAFDQGAAAGRRALTDRADDQGTTAGTTVAPARPRADATN
ncbi:hypothetical protein [Micromonospora sp. NPDC051006]|uniref:hypothetical protein n=1 Tax=Micromonospora sp. NPDC051006 TaxID=3364283 RepID=UPI0037A54AE9